MKKILLKLFFHQKIAIWLMSMTGIFAVFNFVHAQDDKVQGWVNQIIFGLLTSLMNNIVLPLINLIVKIVSYNDFLDAHAVVIGWPLVRDVANMFFVVFFLVIAFATILRISAYQYKNTLFKLLLMAILINFSKTILGLMIDFGQVLMLTFVGAFRDSAAQSLVQGFGMTEILKVSIDNDTGEGGATVDKGEIFASLIMGLIMTVVTAGVLIAYAAVLIYRIITLWVLLILSPMAFLLSAFPGTSKYASELWSNFFKQLTTGIILAFFMWLAFAILSFGFGGQTVTGNQADASVNEVWDRLYTFIVTTALLLIALQYAQQAGGFAGSFAGKVSGKLSDMGRKVAAVPGRLGLKAAKLGKEGLKLAGNDLIIDNLYKHTGVDLNMKRNKERIKQALADRRNRKLDEGAQKAEEAIHSGKFIHARMAMATGGAADHIARYGFWKGVGKIVNPRSKMGKKGQEASDTEFDDAQDMTREIAELKRISDAGGSASLYLNQRKDTIRQDRATKEQRLEELKEKKSRGTATADDQKEINDLEKRLKEIEDEERRIKIHLMATDIDFDASDEDLDIQISRHKKQWDDLLKKEREVNHEIARLRKEGKAATKPEDRKKIADEINGKRDELKGIKNDKDDFQLLRASYKLDEYDSATSIDHFKLNRIRGARDAQNKEVQTMSVEHRNNRKTELEEKKKKTTNQEEIKEIDRQLKVLSIQSSQSAFLSNTDKDNLKEEMKALTKQRDEKLKKSSQYKPTVGFEAQRAQRHAEAEEMEKIRDVENDEELINMYREAELDKNHSRMAAIMRKLAKDGNFNEILNAYGYDANRAGSEEFFKEHVMNKGGMHDQRAISLANDISFINEANGQYGMSRLAKMQNGTWKFMTEKEHAEARTTQLLKKGSRDITSKHNRLAFGGEDGEGNFHIDLGGQVTLRQVAANWIGQPRLIDEQMNPNLAMKLLEAEMKYNEISHALKGIKTNTGKLASDVITEMLRKKVGASKTKLERVGDSVSFLSY